MIRLDRVSRTYRMGDTMVRALRGVSAEIPAGAFAVVVGRSGSGKSTLLHLLAAMDKPSDGAVWVGDTDLSTLSAQGQARYRRTKVGMIFQQFHLVPTMTAAENVALPLVLAGADREAQAAAAEAALERVGLAHRTTHRPAELSGGEQQRVAIARALVADPPMLLCDEPTGNLDSETARQVVDLLADVCQSQGKTVVVVTHHEAEVAHVATHRLRLTDGRLDA
ncbi:MAG: ABC transporter ATP-binding protein [Bacteroidetes bacterium]|nr:ABC transporter ATP-binding protein [Bacteroidota bacterium]